MKYYQYNPLPTELSGSKEFDGPFALEVEVKEPQLKAANKLQLRGLGGFLFLIAAAMISIAFKIQQKVPSMNFGLADSNETYPYSTLDPRELGLSLALRPANSLPGTVFGVLQGANIPLPTNTWCENLLLGFGNYSDVANRAFQLPYLVETTQFIIVSKFKIL